LKKRASGLLTKTRKVDKFMPAEGQRSGEEEVIVQPEKVVCDGKPRTEEQS
jgi:hypothetical protein